MNSNVLMHILADPVVGNENEKNTSNDTNDPNNVNISTINGIVEFVAPHGVRIRYLPESAAEKLCTPDYDRGHILQFSDSLGVQKFAYVLTINEYVYIYIYIYICVYIFIYVYIYIYINIYSYTYIHI